MNNTITLNADSLKELKKAYDKAVLEKRNIFVFEGHELLTSYAYYLIEYADMQLKPKRK